MTALKGKPYLLKLLGFTLLLWAAVLTIRAVVSAAIDPRAEWILIFFSLLTFLSLRMIETFSTPDGTSFMTIYFGTMVFRLFLSVTAASVFILTERENVLVFAVNFMVFYLLYLGFEIYTLFSILRDHFKGDSPDDS